MIGPRSELILRQDLADVLRAIDGASWAIFERSDGADLADFRAGFVAGLAAVAAAYDLRPESRAEVTTWPALPSWR